MLQLNLPDYNFTIKKQNNKLVIFDSQRKKYVSLTPEEWVRQNFIRFLVDNKGYPAAKIAIEKELNVNGMKKRCDAILYDEFAQPQLIVELKAPHIKITQSTFDQVAVYNSKLKVQYFILSNGIEHYCCKVDIENARYNFFGEIPLFSELIQNL